MCGSDLRDHSLGLTKVANKTDDGGPMPMDIGAVLAAIAGKGQEKGKGKGKDKGKQKGYTGQDKGGKKGGKGKGKDEKGKGKGQDSKGKSKGKGDSGKQGGKNSQVSNPDAGKTMPQLPEIWSCCKELLVESSIRG